LERWGRDSWSAAIRLSETHGHHTHTHREREKNTTLQEARILQSKKKKTSMGMELGLT